MDLQFLKDLSPVAILAVVVLYAIKVFAPMIKTALEQIPASIKELTKFITSLIETMKESQKESKATTSAIAGLAETTSLNGVGQAKALDLIATSLNTAMDRQQQYGSIIQDARNTGAQTLAATLAVGGQVSGLEEMVGSILQIALDLNEGKPLIERLDAIEARFLEALRLIKADTTDSEPHVVKVPEGTLAVDIQVEKKVEVQP